MEKIIVVHMNDGDKIDYEITKNKITFNDELMINLEKYERDDPIHIDVCMDQFGSLAMGLASNYVAQIDIPAREYVTVEDGTDEEGNPNMRSEAVPFDIKKCTLSLWGLNTYGN